MSAPETIQRVRIYVSEQDQAQGQPLYLAILEVLQREGASGATAVRGIAGFGPSYRLRATGIAGISDHAPIIIEWIDRAEPISNILSLLNDLVPNALITVEPVTIYRAILRSHGPFSSDQSVGDVMSPNPQTITPDAQLGKVLAMMLAYHQPLMPVLDDQQRMVGVVSEQDIAQRTGLNIPLRLFDLLTDEERRSVITPFTGITVMDVLNSEPRTVYVGAAIPQALVTMVEWNYDQIMVVDRAGLLVGLLSADDVLRAFVERTKGPTSAIRDVEPPLPVRLVMQTAVPHIGISQTLAVALQQLLTTPNRYLVVIDSAGRVQGTLSDQGVFQHITGAERATILNLLQRNKEMTLAELPGHTRGFADMLEREMLTVAPTENIIDATRRLLEGRLERLPVVDPDGKLMGLLARGGLMRALVQEIR